MASLKMDYFMDKVVYSFQMALNISDHLNLVERMGKDQITMSIRKPFIMGPFAKISDMGKVKKYGAMEIHMTETTLMALKVDLDQRDKMMVSPSQVNGLKISLKERAPQNLMGKDMREDLLKDISQDLEFAKGRPRKESSFMKASGKKTREMEQGFIDTLVAMFMKDFGKMISERVKETIHLRMEKQFRETGKMINQMDMLL